MRTKLPKGLFYRKGSSVIWCWYYVKGRAQPVKESTRTTDPEAAARFLHARKAEHPTARAQRLARDAVTVNEALTLYEADMKRNGRLVHRGRVQALRAALGNTKLADLTRDQLDRLCDEWQEVGVRYPERDTKLHRVRPISRASCNRLMATLHTARELAMDKLNVELPRLTFPRFAEKPAGQYVSPAEFYAILQHIPHPTKRAFVELLYLLALRPGQLKSTETSNVRVERGQVVALVYRPEQVKQRTPHEVPLVGRAQALVQELWQGRQLRSRLLFQIGGKRLGELKSEWRRACASAGLTAGRKGGGIVLYNLRHSCLTNLAEAGVPDSTARSISGHKTDSAHKRYVITQSATKAAALAAMSDAVEAAKG